MKILLFSNTDWYMYNFNLSIAIALRNEGHEVVLLTPDGPYGEKLLNLGFRWVAAPMDRGGLNIIREIIFIVWLVRFMAKERFNLVHSFAIKCAVYGSLAGRLIGVHNRINAVTGMGYVFTNKGMKARLMRPFISVILRLALKGDCSRLVVLNHDDAAFAEHNLLMPKEVIRLLPGAGIDCVKFRPLELQKKSEIFTVLLPARLLWDKGLAEYIEAIRILLDQGRAINFLLAGAHDPGNPSSVSMEILSGWIDEGIIKWLGHVNDMPNLYRSVDAVVLPSYREGLPTGLTEAAACGLPLITTDVPGCREVVVNEVNGLLVPVGDVGALAAAIARLQDDLNLCHRFGSMARKKALTEFDNSIVINKTLKIYNDLLIG